MDDATMTTEEMWDALIELGVSEETLQCVSNINGYSKETMQDVLYCGTQTACRSFSQLEDEEQDGN